MSRRAFFEMSAGDEQYLSDRFGRHDLFSNEVFEAHRLPDSKQCEILSVFINSRLDEGTLRDLPNLKLIATRSTGYDHIDLNYCRAHGISVSNVPVYGDNTVAEHTFALILALSRKVIQ